MTLTDSFLKKLFCVVGAAFCGWFLTVNSTFAQGTAFTYQGRLNSGGNPANGLYDFQFSLSNAPSGGSQVGSNFTVAAVGVTNGMFATTLDFGPVFTGIPIWLGISVRPNGAGSYTALNPLQPLTPVPYAITAGRANNLAGLSVQEDGSGFPNLIGGAAINSVSSGVEGATIGGGGSTNIISSSPNRVTAGYGTVGGGLGNTAGGIISAAAATVGGGSGNTAGGDFSTVGGGSGNTASGEWSTVPGGTGNIAGGHHSFAAGSFAQATNVGAFVWADSQPGVFGSSANDSFNVRAHGGVNFVTSGAGMTLDGQNINTATNLKGTIPQSNLGSSGTFTPIMGEYQDGEGPGWVDDAFEPSADPEVFKTKTATGNYVIMGSLVYFETTVNWTNRESAVGQDPVVITLPFYEESFFGTTFTSVSAPASFTIGYMTGINIAGQITAKADRGFQYLQLYASTTSGVSSVTVSDCANSGTIELSGFYRWQ